jgi:hypothetical protein
VAASNTDLKNHVHEGGKMTSSFPLSKALGAGAIAGALVLGLFVRIATALLALATRHPHNLSARGLAEVVILGAILGAIGGIVLLLLRGKRYESQLASGLILGGLVFFGSFLASWAGGRLDFSQSNLLLLTLAVAAMFCFVYGMLARALFQRFMLGDQRGKP